MGTVCCDTPPWKILAAMQLPKVFAHHSHPSSAPLDPSIISLEEEPDRGLAKEHFWVWVFGHVETLRPLTDCRTLSVSSFFLLYHPWHHLGSSWTWLVSLCFTELGSRCELDSDLVNVTLLHWELNLKLVRVFAMYREFWRNLCGYGLYHVVKLYTSTPIISGKLCQYIRRNLAGDRFDGDQSFVSKSSFCISLET